MEKPTLRPISRWVNRFITLPATPMAEKAPVACRLSYNHHIHGVIKLLDQIPRQQREGQPDQLPVDASLGEGSPVHGAASFCPVHPTRFFDSCKMHIPVL